MTELHKACKAGDTARVADLLGQSRDALAVQDLRGWRPLDYAAVQGSLDVVRCLLEHGADPLDSDLGGYTPLSRAVKAQHEAVALALLDAAVAFPRHRAEVRAPRSIHHFFGAVLPAQDPSGPDALFVLAWRGGMLRLADRLWQGHKISAAASQEALWMAAARGEMAWLRTLWDEPGAFSALQAALYGNQEEAARFCLDRDKWISDATVQQCVRTHPAMVPLLREYHADLVAEVEARLHRWDTCTHPNLTHDGCPDCPLIL